MDVMADDPRFVELLKYLMAYIQEAPDQALLQVSRMLKLESEGAAGVPGVNADGPMEESALWLAEQASSRKLSGRLGDRGLPFQVSCLMNDPVITPPECLRSGKVPRAGLGYADQRRAWSSILRECGKIPEDMAAVLAWVQAEKDARAEAPERAPPGLERPQRRSCRPGPPGLELSRRLRSVRPCAAEGLRGGSRSGGGSLPLRLPMATAAIRLVSTAWGHPALPHVGHARQFDCQLYFGDDALAGADRQDGHHGGHPDQLQAAARHPHMQTALAALDQTIDSQHGPAPLEVLFLMCHTGRGASVSVAILLGELLQQLGYAVHIQHCSLQNGDPHEQVCESCRARRPLPETSSLLMLRWHDPSRSENAET